MSRADLKMGDRGFAEYGEGEHGEETWRVCESSIAGDPQCWLFLKKKDAPEEDQGGSLHLNVEQALQLGVDLQAVVDPKNVLEVSVGRCTYGMRWEATGGFSEAPKLVVHGKYAGSDVEHRGSLTLTKEVVRDVVRALRRFLEDAADPGHWKNAPSYAEVWRQPDWKLTLGTMIEDVCESIAQCELGNENGASVIKAHVARALIDACTEWPTTLDNPEFGGSLEDLICDSLDLEHEEFKKLFQAVGVKSV